MSTKVCTISFQGESYDLDKFKDLLKGGLLYNLLDRGVIDLPIDKQSVKPETNTRQFNEHFVSSKADVEKSLSKVFGLPLGQAKAAADLYYRVAKSWAVRTGKSVSDYFNTLSIFKGNPEKLTSESHPALYTQEQLTQLSKEKEEVRANTKSYNLFKAPNKKKTNLTEDQWLTVQTPTFKKWFGDSKAVDENGEPKIFYHGSMAKFDTFDPNITGKNVGIFLTPEIDFALDYTTKNEGSDFHNVIELFAKADKIFDYDNPEHLKLAKNAGDSVLLSMDRIKSKYSDNNWAAMESDTIQKFLKDNGFDSYYVKEQGIKNLAVYDPTQVKVSDGRNQTFAEDNPNMLFQSTSSGVRDAVAKGFGLQADPSAFSGAFRTESGKATPELAKRINDWLKATGQDHLIEYKYEKTYGTVNAIPKRDNLLFQDNSITVKRIKEKINTNTTALKDILEARKKGFTQSLENADTDMEREMSEDILSDTNKALSELEKGKTSGAIKYLSRGTPDFAKKLLDAGVLTKSEAEVFEQHNRQDGVWFDDFETDFNDEGSSFYTPQDYILNQTAKGAILLGKDGRDIIYALSNPDVSTPVHELAHRWERELTDDERKTVLDWSKQDTWDRDTSEKFARGFEKFLSDGKAPSSALEKIFNAFKQWLVDIYKGVKGSAIDIELNEGMKEVYSKMLGENYEQKLNEEVQQEAANETTPVTPQEQPVQEPQTEPALQVQPIQQVPTLEDTQTWKKPFVGSAEEKVAYTNDVQENYRNGNYDQLIASGDMSEEDLRSVINSAGLPADLVDRVMFRALNKGVEYSINQLVDLHQLGSPEFQIVGNYFLDSDRFKDALTNDMVSPEDAKTMLNTLSPDSPELQEKKNSLIKLADEKIASTEERITTTAKRIADLKAQLGETSKFVKVSQDSGIRSERLPKGASAELVKRQSAMVNVAERLRKVLPSVPFDLVFDDGDWKGRIINGRAEINLNKADLNTPIHEILHPFILDLKNRNPDLYFNLTQELRLNFQDYIDSVKNNPKYGSLSEPEKEDEALVQYLGDSVQKYFKQDGTINQDVINDNLVQTGNKGSAFMKFFTWLRDTVTAFWKTISNLKSSPKDSINDVDYVTYNKETGLITGNKAKTNSVQDLVKTGTGTYKSITGNTLTTADDRTFTTNSSDDSDLQSRGITPDVLNQIKDIASKDESNVAEININKLKLSPKKNLDAATPTTDVTALPVDFTLQNVADVIGAQQQLSFDLSGSQHAIDAMEAYQFDQAAASDRFMKRTQDRLEQLRDTAERRTLVGEIASDNVIGLRRILRDYKGVEAMNAYIEYGVRSLNGANWLVHQIHDTLSKAREGFVAGRDANDKLIWIKSNTDPLTDKLINELNDRLFQARQLIGFYEDADENSLTKLTSIYSEGFDEKELGHFNKILKNTNEARMDIGKIANGLITDWLYPTIEKTQVNLPDYKKITRQQFSQNLRVADQDVSTISYWMQAVINSRDPINAALAIVVKDKLVSHHEEERQTNFELRTAYAKFLSDKGIPNTQKAVEDFYKKNYLRKATTWEVFGFKKVPEGSKIGDTVKYGKYDGVITSLENGVAKVSGYMQRDAFHEKFYWDKHFDDLRLFKEGYENRFGHPAGDNQWDAFNKAVADWDAQNNPQYGGTKYVNQNFAALANDEYFNMLYSTYKDSNEKYGERKLNYGIVPQAYRKSNSLVSTWETLKAIPDNLKATFSDKTKPTSEKIESLGADVGNFMFDKQPYLREQDLNLDGSYYRGVKSPFTHLVDPDHLDLRLNESVLGFQSAANMFSSLREVQSNVENLKMLIEGNPLFSIKGRQVARRSPSNISASNPSGTVFDRFAKRPEKDYAVKLNKQLTSFINDIFYGDGEFQSNVALGKVNINLNTAGSRLGFLTALHTMAGSLFGGISNVAIGNIMTLGEAIGGKYYKPKNWAWAQKEYSIRIPNFLADISNPVKSKITQLGILYDAIQGEFRDKYGKNITGSAMKRYATNDTFFIINHTGEHQIQLTGMLALMDATKVTLRDGSKVSLYDAYKVNDKGFYKLRDDAVWSKEEDAKFIKTLHGISRDLNGNYAAFDKSMLQRYWWGKLAMQYRKYLYSAWRSRFASERVDWERGDVQAGYYRTFLTKFWQDAKDYNGNIIASTFNTIAGKKGFTAEQHYARRRTMFDIAVIVGTTMLAGSLAGMEKENQDDADKKAQERLLLTVLRFRSDISQYSWTLPQNVWQTVDNPSASLQLLQNYGKFFSQLLNDPIETYSQNGSGYNKGDSKLGNKFEKIIPLYRQWLRWQTPDQQIKFYNLYGKNVKPGATSQSN